MIDPNDFQVKGTEIQYYLICRRKLWFFQHNLGTEHRSDLVLLGKIIDEIYFKKEQRENKDVDDFIKVDFISTKDGVIVHEIKKSRKMEDVHEWQVKYYLYVLKSRGLKIIKGVLHYPVSKQIKEVHLNECDINKIENMLLEIEKIRKLKSPPKPEKKKYCNKCAYYWFCWVGENE